MRNKFNLGILIVVGCFLLCLALIWIIKPEGEWGSVYVIAPIMVLMLAFLIWNVSRK